MPKVCELCGCNAKAGHDQACKVINEIHIKVRKKYNAIKVTAGNDNRALDNKKPDVENGRNPYGTYYVKQQNTNTDFMQLIYCRDFAFKSKDYALPLIPKIHTSHPKDCYKDIFRGQQCQFKCRTNLGCLRRLFRVTILEDEV
ncbi:Hypothetical_protein [Hexamita inflata]|uniref:Hypothetical_protein n=1 Tax=Hexamita inflata TaxID=28002 RepID=A0AA86U9P0_9EUKA|nr:Hypothetical protein HINF_LOCUS31861 [Hexamita inflata]